MVKALSEVSIWKTSPGKQTSGSPKSSRYGPVDALIAFHVPLETWIKRQNFNYKKMFEVHLFGRFLEKTNPPRQKLANGPEDD